MEATEGHGSLSPHPCTVSSAFPRTKMVDTWEPDSRGHPRPGKGKPETFDIQGLVSGRTRVKILVRCAAPSSNQNLGAVRLSCHSPCLSVGRCTTPSKGIKNLPRSPAGPCKGGIAPRLLEG